MTLREWIIEGGAKLSQAGLQCADPLLHMKQMVSVGLGLEPTQIYTRWEENLAEAAEIKLNEILRRRLSGEPFQYIVGHEWFWKTPFEVGPGVLIPRRETEHLVELLLKEKPNETLKVAELGAGSGNIGISILLERPQWEWHGFEMNPQSIPYLGRNVGKQLPLEAKYFIHEANFFDAAKMQSPFDAIVSNPPYVARSVETDLSKEVRQEPELALFGGESGTTVLSHLIPLGYVLLRQGGLFLTEIGCDQEAFVRHSLEKSGFIEIEVLKDYAGLPRVAKGVK